MNPYKEKNLEDFIEKHLLDSGYISCTDSHYDKNLCLDTKKLYDFILSTQSQQLDELKKRVREDLKSFFLKHIASIIRERGILRALQFPIEIMGVNFSLIYPKPKSNANALSLENYKKNTFCVIRQLHYSTRNQNSLDMVIFINGIPIITMELKNQFTGQNFQNAIWQYQKDRDPKEELFNRCVVHFALDSDQVYMTTNLEGEKSVFLPFNRGLNNGSGEIGRKSGAGNPPSKGVKTAYLWEHILAKDTLITLLLEFVKTMDGRVIFPRYHQLDVVEKLLKDIQENGIGRRYLIQHSTGSGKSNSISWLALALADLHVKDQIVFDGVIVVTDRRVLDRQIQENIKNFSHTKGVVESITDGSRQLKEALEEGKKIIISTIQKFPYILDAIKEVKGKTFAIIIDEAHSSQNGSSAQKLGEVIRNRESKDKDSALNGEDVIVEMIKNKKLQPNASYFAFTATPKPKTLEMFGTSYRIEGEEKFIPFHLYSMKQAIEEGFILDVLKAYTTYNTYYKIISTASDDPRFDRRKAGDKIKRYVEGHTYTISEKAKVMIEHFYSNTCKKIDTKAKAMIVANSRQSAIKYLFAFREHLREKNPSYKALVAFSGEVMLDGQSYSESGLNDISESRLAEEFKKDEYRFLIVAEKYQTGFDQPFLHTMYVDKKLSGVSAVQTLSRLNRITKNKQDSCVLDFANSHEDIAKAFEPFFEQTYLKEATDYNQIFDLKSSLNEYGVYRLQEIDNFVEAILRGEKEGAIHSQLDVMANRYHHLEENARAEFYNKANNYCKHYSFLAQILPFEDRELEKLSILLSMLVTKLIPPKDVDLALGVTKNIDLESYRLQLDKTLNISLEGNGELRPHQADGTSKMPETELERISEIVKSFNKLYEDIGWGEDDKVIVMLKSFIDDTRQNKNLLSSFKQSDKQNMKIIFEEVLKEWIQENVHTHFMFYKKYNDDKNFNTEFAKKMFDEVIRGMEIEA